MSTTRTNIHIDDEALQLVMQRYGLNTKTESVNLALKRLAFEPMTAGEALAMRGAQAIVEVPVDETPLEL
ncbi:MAG: type II toxin-antitoxin system VapB family antitoxin [Deinococcota bacterium]